MIEGGITGVVLANLYKPLVDHDNKKISAVLVTAKKFFNKIGYLFIAYSIGVAVVYPILSKEGFSWSFVASLTVVLSLNLLIQYLFSLSFRVLLQADKKLYVISFTQIVITVCNIACAFFSVKIYPSIHLLKLLTGLLYIIQPLVYGYFVKKHYSINWGTEPDDNLLKERWNGFAINCAAFIHNSTDITILTIFTNLATVSIYGVYTLVTNGLNGLFAAVFRAIAPTVGQAYAKGDEHELNKKLDLFEFITFISVYFCFTLSGLLITPFVQLYTNGITDVDYIQPMWDKDEESRRMCELTMPAIRENYYKFDRFYHERFTRTSKRYTAQNFNGICKDEEISGFVCGSDTIFCPDEFGFDDGYYANYECMKKHSVAYAASFGDPHFTDETYKVLNDRLQNFNAFGLREKLMVPYVTKHTNVPVKKVIDPTLLLTSDDYDKIAKERLQQDKYLLLYARRYNPKMEAYAEKIATENGWKIVEISLRATNAEKPNHQMLR